MTQTNYEKKTPVNTIILLLFNFIFFTFFAYLDTYEHLPNSKENFLQEIIDLPKPIISLLRFLKSLMTSTQICQVLSAGKNVEIILFAF